MHFDSALDELIDRSNICGTSGEKEYDKTWVTTGLRTMVISDP